MIRVVLCRRIIRLIVKFVIKGPHDHHDSSSGSAGEELVNFSLASGKAVALSVGAQTTWGAMKARLLQGNELGLVTPGMTIIFSACGQLLLDADIATAAIGDVLVVLVQQQLVQV